MEHLVQLKTKLITKAGLLTFITIYAGITSAAEYRPTVEKPLCDGKPANFYPFLVEKRQWYWELVESRDEAPTIWAERADNKLRIGFHAAADITYWTCPPDGDSVEASIHKPFVAIYEGSSDTSSSPFSQSLIGYTPIDFYQPKAVTLNPSVQVIDDLNTYYDEIDGSGASLEYRGPNTKVNVGILPDFDPEQSEMVEVTFPNACGEKMPLVVQYRRVSSVGPGGQR